jgi:hypothetical protein
LERAAAVDGSHTTLPLARVLVNTVGARASPPRLRLVAVLNTAEARLRPQHRVGRCPSLRDSAVPNRPQYVGHEHVRAPAGLQDPVLQPSGSAERGAWRLWPDHASPTTRPDHDRPLSHALTPSRPPSPRRATTSCPATSTARSSAATPTTTALRRAPPRAGTARPRASTPAPAASTPRRAPARAPSARAPSPARRRRRRRSYARSPRSAATPPRFCGRWS